MKAIYLLLLCLAAPFFIKAQDMHSLSLKPISIDGSPEDWPQPFNYYDSGTKLQYAMANDTANLYICLKITDEPAQMKLLRAGMTVWVDPKGKRKETMGISFPLKQDRSAEGEMPQHIRGEGQIPGQTFQKHDFRRFSARATSQQTTIRIKGFAGVPEQSAPLKNNFQINVAFGWDTFDILCIEYQIPLSLVLNHHLLPSDTIKPIGVGFVVNAMEISGNHGGGNGEESRGNREDGEEGNDMGGEQGMGGMNGGMGRMNGGMGGGGMDKGGMGGGMNRNGGGFHGSSFNEAAQAQKVWSKLLLHYL